MASKSMFFSSTGVSPYIFNFLRLRACDTDFEECLSMWRVVPFCSTRDINKEVLLTTDEGYVVQPLPPLFTDLDRLLLLHLFLGRHAQVVGVFYDILHVLWLESVHDIEEVRAIGKSPIGGGVRQVPHDLLVALEHGVELPDGELVVQRHVHRPHPGHG